MPYSETDKLQHEVEKLIEEIKVLQKPLVMQPSVLFPFVGLVLSLLLNIKQYSEVKNAEVLAKIDVANLKLEKEKISKTNDSLKLRKDSLLTETTSIGNDIILLGLSRDSFRIRVNEAKKLIANLSTLPYKKEQDLKTITEVKKRFDSLSAKNNKEAITSNYFTKNSSKNLQLASTKEREGFECLLKQDYNCASKAFLQSENAYNGYNNVYELARLIIANKEELVKNPKKREEVISIILKNYRQKIPQDILNQLKDEIM